MLSIWYSVRPQLFTAVKGAKMTSFWLFFFLKLKKLIKLLLKKKKKHSFLFFSFSLLSDSLSLSYSITLSHSAVVQGLTAAVGLHPQPPCHRRPPPLSLRYSLHQNLKPKVSYPSPPKSKSKENNLKPKLHTQNPMIISFTI